jgi:SAM-dependent methyltransferase
LLLIGAARHLMTGKAIGVDTWVRGAISDNRQQAPLDNAMLAGVADRVVVEHGDARRLPFPDATFDVVVSNFVVHEMDTDKDRDQMLREIARVLKPGGRVALVDFIFTGQAVRVWRSQGLPEARRTRIGNLGFLGFALLTLGAGRLYLVTGHKVAVSDPEAAAA